METRTSAVTGPNTGSRRRGSRMSAVPTKAADAQLVVIGSSAGGIEALSRVVASLPSDFPAPIVIAQHLDPRRPSHLGEILSRHATLPIKVVEDSAALEDGVIFVVPSNRLVEIVEGKLRLRPAKPGSVAPSVDLLLETAAAAFGPGLTAVILTGSGSDGSAGAWHVKQAGGSVVIENPATAMFPSMPRSISPSLVDATADLDSIGTVLRDLLARGRRPRRTAATARSSRRCSIGSASAAGSTSAPTRPRRSSAACAAGWARRAIRRSAAYAKQLEQRSGGVRQAHQQPPDQGDRVLPRSEGLPVPPRPDAAGADRRGPAARPRSCASGRPAARPAKRPIRSRSTLAEAMGDEPDPLDVRVFATDIDSAAIAFARRGLYPPAALQKVPPALRERYFVKSDGGYEVAKSLAVADDLRRARSRGAGAVPTDRPHPVPQRPHLLHAADAAGRARDVRVLAARRRTPRPGPVRDGRGDARAVRRGTRPAADLSPRPRAARRCPLARAKPIRPPREPRGAPRRRRSGRPAATSRSAADSTEAAEALLLDLGLGVVVVDRPLLHHPDQHGRPADARDPRPGLRPGLHPSRRVPPIDRRSGRPSMPRWAGRPRPRSTRSRRPTSRPKGRRFIEAVVRPYVRQAGTVEGAVIELSDVSSGRTRSPVQRARRPPPRTRGGRQSPAPAAPTTS